ncbi:MAG: aminotransferase [Pseudomonadales bacterium]|nr:aminotransferase [Pseudomonadales bacterium]
MKLEELSITQIEERQLQLEKQYAAYKSAGLSLDLTRGKPGAEQLDLSNSLDGILQGFYLLQDGTDVRNYGGLTGIPEARKLGGLFMDLPAEEVMVGGNSSLTLMYNYIHFMMESVWLAESQVSNATIKFLCPVPGYDRHFTICDAFNIEMIPVDMLDDGPDMGQIERLIAQDASIKGIWCVPKYSNPTGVTYTSQVVERFAKLPTNAGNHFKIMWDNAYAVHDLNDQPDQLANLMDAAREAETTESIVMFASTSKVTFAGSGISFIGLSQDNLKAFETFLSASAIGPDKVNQLRHVRFLVDAAGIQAHMRKHRDIIGPKFEMVDNVLSQHLGGKGIARWTKPMGGYFVSLDTLPGLASTIITMAGDVGVKLTPAGATFPNGDDPRNQNIRIAPTFPSTQALRQALEVFVVCLELASIKQLLER